MCSRHDGCRGVEGATDMRHEVERRLALVRAVDFHADDAHLPSRASTWPSGSHPPIGSFLPEKR